MERINIVRQTMGVMVNVTRKDGDAQVHWRERVLDPTPASIHLAIEVCRRRCEALAEGVALAGQP